MGSEPGTGSSVLRLPSLDLPAEENPPTEALLTALGNRLGVRLTSLRFRPAGNEARDSGTVVFHLEPLTATDDLRYADIAEVRAGLATLEPAEAREEVRWWLDHLDSQADPREGPWTRAGWFERASAWTISRLTEVGLPPTEPPKIMYQDVLGTVLRTRSGDRATYMKCPVPYFRAEVTIAAALARRTAHMVPEVLAVEPAEGWLLMGDVGDRILGKQPESTWADGIRQIPALQRAWIGHTDELAAAGAQVRPVDSLAAALPGFLDRGGLADRLEPDVRARWIEALPRLVDMCHQLDAIGLPDTVVHGDMHPWNIAMNDTGLRVFDWSDGAVGHPFVDLPPFLWRAKDVAFVPGLQAAYLDGWSDFMPRDRLQTAADLATTVGALYQVETYLRLIPALDPHDHKAFDKADARWLTRALETPLS
jgi:hypothetical protein